MIHSSHKKKEVRLPTFYGQHYKWNQSFKTSRITRRRNRRVQGYGRSRNWTVDVMEEGG